MPRKKLKKAYKTFKFWYEVLKSGNLMNDTEHQLEYQTALQTIKNYSQKE